MTETYAALKLYVDNWRWRGVPFYLITGKRMAEARSMVSICFRHPPMQLFRGTQVECMSPNWILLGIQPEESLRIQLTAESDDLLERRSAAWSRLLAQLRRLLRSAGYTVAQWFHT